MAVETPCGATADLLAMMLEMRLRKCSKCDGFCFFPTLSSPSKMLQQSFS